jgi:hypothetical protein
MSKVAAAVLDDAGGLAAAGDQAAAIPVSDDRLEIPRTGGRLKLSRTGMLMWLARHCQRQTRRGLFARRIFAIVVRGPVDLVQGAGIGRNLSCNPHAC